MFFAEGVKSLAFRGVGHALSSDMLEEVGFLLGGRSLGCFVFVFFVVVCLLSLHFKGWYVLFVGVVCLADVF